MSRNLIALFFYFLILLTPGGQAQNKPAPPVDDTAYTLTERQMEQYGRFDTDEEKLSQAMQAIISRAGTSPVEAQTSMTIHAALKDVYRSSELVQTQREAWLNRLRAEQSCPGCTIRGGKL